MYQSPSDRPPLPSKVVLSKRDVADAARLLSILLDQKSEPMEVSLGADETSCSGRLADADATALADLARKVFKARRARQRFFSKAMFGEPAWDMLLALYMMDITGARQTVGRLTDLSNSPATSALRWLRYLEREKLILREPHPNDRRVTFVELSSKGRSALEDYLLLFSQQLGLA